LLVGKLLKTRAFLVISERLHHKNNADSNQQRVNPPKRENKLIGAT
jgi:hypothetical protein